MNKMNLRKALEDAIAKWPSTIVARPQVGAFTGGMISPKTLANCSSLGIGPPQVKLGNRIGYETETLVQWLVERYGE